MANPTTSRARADKKSLPIALAPAETPLPVGTRIRFTRRLDAPATGDRPAVVYAERGEAGVVVGHDAREGYQVKAAGWPEWFGASRDEFESAEGVEPAREPMTAHEMTCAISWASRELDPAVAARLTTPQLVGRINQADDYIRALAAEVLRLRPDLAAEVETKL